MKRNCPMHLGMIPAGRRPIRMGLYRLGGGKPGRLAGAALLSALPCFPALAQLPDIEPEAPASSMAAADSSGWFWTVNGWRPTLRRSDGRFTMSVRARLQLDAGWFDQSQDVHDIAPDRDVEFKDLRSGTNTRRAYLGVEGRAFGSLSYEYRMNFGDTRSFLTNPNVNIARVSYNAGNLGNPDRAHFRIDAGFIRPMFTFGDSTSSAALLFLERADAGNVASTAYGGGTPRLGLQFIFQTPDSLQQGDNFVVSGARSNGRSPSNNTVFPSNSSFAGKQIIGRIAYRLPFGEFDGVQLGGNASHILSVAENAAENGARTIILQDFPETRIDGNRLVSTGPVRASGGSLLGMESAVNFGNIYASGEYYRFEVERDMQCAGCAGLGDPNFSGWYVAASWVLTGERRPYQAVSNSNTFATFGNPEVESDFSLKDRHWGVWELAVRYSDLDLNWHAGTPRTACADAGCIRGGKEIIWTFGLNWYLTNTIRTQFNYMAVDVDKLNSSGQQIGQAFGALGTRLLLTN